MSVYLSTVLQIYEMEEMCLKRGTGHSAALKMRDYLRNLRFKRLKANEGGRCNWRQRKKS